MLAEVRANVIGVVLNDIDYSSADYRYFNYGSNQDGDKGLYQGIQTVLPADDRKGSDDSPKRKGAHA